MDVAHTYWLNIKNTTIRSSFGSSGKAITAAHVGHFWFGESSVIDNWGTGIDASSGLNWNIRMTEGSTIQQCGTGINLNGSIWTDANNRPVNLGILFMDCARMIQNETAISGRDIIFGAHSRGTNFNTFTKSPSNPNGLYIQSVFEKLNETDVWLFGNFWDNTTPPLTPVNTDWSFLQRTMSCSIDEKWDPSVY
jgi:hypothetical protein